MRTRPQVIGCLLLSFVCLSSVASAQTNWEKTYGGAGNDEGRSVHQTTDGGYIVAGWTYSFGAESGDVYLVKTNAQGDTLWTRTYGGSDGARGNSVQQTKDGGFVIAGYTGPYWVFGLDVYLVRTDASGDTLWTRTYGGTGGDGGNSVQQTTDGGFIVAGWTQQSGVMQSDVYLIKINAQGETLWTRTYGGKNGDAANAVAQTSDGGYIIVGTTASFGAGSGAVYLLKTDASGDTTWTSTYGGLYGAEGSSVQQTADGGFIIAGVTEAVDPENVDVYLIKTNASGDTVWTRTCGWSDWNVGYAVRQTADGGYIVVGSIESHGAGSIDVYLVRTNAGGDTLWTRTYGGSDRDDGLCVQQTSDSGYIVAGCSRSFGAGDNDFYLIKTDGGLDVGSVAILPPESVEVGHVYVPRAVVRNFGLTSGSIFQVTMEIGSGYVQTAQETLLSTPLDTVVFPPWTAGPIGSVSITCFTSLTGDWNPTNDTITDSIMVVPPPEEDIGAIAILSPTGRVRAGDTVIPRARIMNFGETQERFFDVRFRIGPGYNEKVNVADALPAGSTAKLAFQPWVTEPGNWAVSCSTMLGSDADSTNDKVGSSVQVVPQSLSIEPGQTDRIEAGRSKTYRFYALIQGDTGAVVEVTRPSPPQGWSVRLCDATGVNDLTDIDGDGIPDLGYVAPGESGWFSLDVIAPSKTQGDTASLSQTVLLVAGHVGDRPDIADTAVLTLALVPELSIHNFPNPFTDHTSFVIGLPEDGKTTLTVYTRAGERVCRVLANADLSAGVHLVLWNGVNDHGRAIAPGTYEYLLDYAHPGKTDRIRKRLVLTRQ